MVTFCSSPWPKITQNIGICHFKSFTITFFIFCHFLPHFGSSPTTQIWILATLHHCAQCAPKLDPNQSIRQINTNVLKISSFDRFNSISNANAIHQKLNNVNRCDKWRLNLHLVSKNSTSESNSTNSNRKINRKERQHGGNKLSSRRENSKKKKN